jgi:hypothetical chaperone protein
MSFCAIDFGTSNSALALPLGAGNANPSADAAPGSAAGMKLAELEPGFNSIPTAVFYGVEEPGRRYGRDAVAAYVDGLEGRLMRSIKSILGSDLIDQATDVAAGLSVRYRDVVVGYLRHLRATAQQQGGSPLAQVVLGRPVFFVDDDPASDARAETTLAQAARTAGFAEVSFAFEPIAAALDYESRIDRERLVLVADIGGGTSDFSLVRASPTRHHLAERRADILANHGVHIAGTDFDRAVNLGAIQPVLGLGSLRPDGQRVPSSIYHDLSTWHLINTTTTPLRMAELRQMRTLYADGRCHQRLMNVLQRRLGHALAALAEQAKIAVAQDGSTSVDLQVVESGLAVAHDAAAQARALDHDVGRIVAAAHEAVRLAGLTPQAVQALYFTGGSTGFGRLVDAIATAFPQAERVRGDRFTAVVSGLGITARQRYG